GHLVHAFLAGLRPRATGGGADVPVLRDLLPALGVPVGAAVAGASVPAVSRGGDDAGPNHRCRGRLGARPRGVLRGAGNRGSGRGRSPPENPPLAVGAPRGPTTLGGMPVASVFEQLEVLLPKVAKPVQYVGGELNATVKDWDAATVRWALMYPDAYEVGLPNQGIMILYEVLNEQPDVLAERTYAVWPDLEKLMREHGVPQFTVESHRPVGAFDLLGVSFATELGYTNLLTALDLAG